MRSLRRLCAVFVLTLALALSTFAGQIDIGVTSPPPPPQNTTATGQIETTATSTDQVTQTILSLLQSVLALF